MPDYFPIGALRRDKFVVFFRLGPLRLATGEHVKATDVQGYRVTRRKGQSSEHIEYFVIRGDGSPEALSTHIHPTLFRPCNLKNYPDPLPEPSILTKEVNWQFAPCQEIQDVQDNLAWESEYSAPGSISEAEAKVRVLRAWKTQRSPGVDSRGLAGPRGFRPKSSLAPSEATSFLGWEPTRRDIGDWEKAMGWFTKLTDEHHKAVIELRSMDFSFRAIGEKLERRPAEWARRRLATAIREITRIANRKMVAKLAMRQNDACHPLIAQARIDSPMPN